MREAFGKTIGIVVFGLHDNSPCKIYVSPLPPSVQRNGCHAFMEIETAVISFFGRRQFKLRRNHQLSGSVDESPLFPHSYARQILREKLRIIKLRLYRYPT